jgi:uncharacterized protein
MIHGSLGLANTDSLIRKVRKTTNFFERMRGLLGSQKLGNDEGLLIAPCSSVHTFGMRYSIDIIFLDNQLNIVKIVNSLKPWRMAACNSASMVLELCNDNINNLQVKAGQQLEWRDEFAN